MEQYTVKFSRKNIERGTKEIVTIQTHETTLADAFKVALMHGQTHGKIHSLSGRKHNF